jgi:uncharacterized protein
MVGRKDQITRMKDGLRANKSSFVAVTGRRRVGKTYLIEQVYTGHFCFKATGIQAADTKSQINNFVQKITEYSKWPIAQLPTNWQEVFVLFKNYLKKLSKKKKQVIFLDELPWMSTNKSGFLQMLAHLWNDYLSKEKHFILVICGSATSWITQKVINDKGGLHNRITDTIALKPFTLAETKAFFEEKKITLTPTAITEMYMALGGIPYYLEKIKRGESPAQAIERLCFVKEAPFKNEYDNLYKALFDNAENHEAIVAALALSKQGLTREAIIKKSTIKGGGPFTRTIADLIISGFVVEELPFGKTKRGSIYRLVDDYSIFYHRFIKTATKVGKGYWQMQYATQAYKIWAGYAFENICIKHVDAIKKALGVQNVYSTTASFQHLAKGKGEGFQIDLLIDRNDNVINLCECKFYNAPFSIDKKYAVQLHTRKGLFTRLTETRKTVFTTFISNYPLEKNKYYLDAVDNNIIINQLF